MTSSSQPVCRTCGIRIRWQPTVVDDQIYCCLGCAHGGPCECDYDNLPEHDQVKPIVVRKQHKTQMAERA